MSEKTISIADYSACFDSSAFNAPLYFYKKTNQIPSLIKSSNIDIARLYGKLLRKYNINKEQTIVYNFLGTNNFREKMHGFIVPISEDILLYSSEFANPDIDMYFSPSTPSEKLNEVQALFMECQLDRKKKNQIHLLTHNSAYGLDTIGFDMPKREVDIEKNYNDDLLPIHSIITKRLNTEGDKGIVLLHGDPGTGKTTYIRHLLTQVNKEVIFLPPDLSHQIASPDFISFLIDHPNSILVIEDAENVITERVGANNQAVSNLLNIADGLLSDCLNIQLICTFNMDVSNIDKALLRKGRIIAKYEFKALSPDKTKCLMEERNVQFHSGESLTLAEIYNFDHINFENFYKPIGFLQ